jgi:hypothetical protein
MEPQMNADKRKWLCSVEKDGETGEKTGEKIIQLRSQAKIIFTSNDQKIV